MRDKHIENEVIDVAVPDWASWAASGVQYNTIHFDSLTDLVGIAVNSSALSTAVDNTVRVIPTVWSDTLVNTGARLSHEHTMSNYSAFSNPRLLREDGTREELEWDHALQVYKVKHED